MERWGRGANLLFALAGVADHHAEDERRGAQRGKADPRGLGQTGRTGDHIVRIGLHGLGHRANRRRDEDCDTNTQTLELIHFADTVL